MPCCCSLEFSLTWWLLFFLFFLPNSLPSLQSFSSSCSHCYRPTLTSLNFIHLFRVPIALAPSFVIFFSSLFWSVFITINPKQTMARRVIGKRVANWLFGSLAGWLAMRFTQTLEGMPHYTACWAKLKRPMVCNVNVKLGTCFVFFYLLLFSFHFLREIFSTLLQLFQSKNGVVGGGGERL